VPLPPPPLAAAAGRSALWIECADRPV